MKIKHKNWIEAKIRPLMYKASLGNIPEDIMEKIIKGYLKFLDFMFKIITVLTIFVAFAWFFPTYLNLGTERTILILLIAILIHLRFGKTDVVLREE